jgi:nitroimidazol reductase NimA-like FMN-containing flavoprotein (pyridoxamine 5'-phosphate oxidase superfamily)
MPKRWMKERRELEDLLDEPMVGRLATCQDGVPYITPLNFVYREGVIYFHCHLRGRKLDNIRANPRVCFEVDEVRKLYRAPKGCDYGCRYRSVLAFGTARIVEDLSEKLRILDWLVAKHADGQEYEPVEAARAAACHVVAVHVEEMTGKENVDPPVRPG